MDYEQPRFDFTPTRVSGAIKFASAAFNRGVVKRWRWRDTRQPKLILVVGPRSAKFYCRESVAGRERTRPIGPADGPDAVRIETARNECGTARSVARAIATPGTTAPRRCGITVDRAWAEYIAAARAGTFSPRGRSRRPLRPKTADGYANDYRLYVAPQFGGRDVSELARHASAIVDGIQQRPDVDGRALANNVRQVIRNIFAYLIRSGAWPAANPTDAILKFEVDRREPVVTPSDAVALLAAINDVGHYREMFLFLALTGRRLGNALNLRWEQIRDGVIYYPPDSIKTNQPERVPVTVEIAGLLEIRRGINPPDCPWVWPNQSDPQRPARNPHHAWKRVCDTAGGHIRIHDLRHVAVSTAAAAGIGSGAIQSMTGHRDLAGLERYLHGTPEAAAVAMRAVAAMWASAGIVLDGVNNETKR